MDLATIAEMTPGPIAINGATFVGLRVAGAPGAIIATFGCILPSLIIVSLLAVIYRRYRSLPALQSVLAARESELGFPDFPAVGKYRAVCRGDLSAEEVQAESDPGHGFVRGVRASDGGA